MLEAAAITKTFGGKHVLGPLDLHLDASERLAVTGPNGAGKSTLIRCIAGTLAPAEAVGALGIFGLVFSVALRHAVRRGTLNQY